MHFFFYSMYSTDKLKQKISIIYRDESWLVVNKPYDMRIQKYPNSTDPSGMELTCHCYVLLTTK